jgi:hypothetical protein
MVTANIGEYGTQPPRRPASAPACGRLSSSVVLPPYAAPFSPTHTPQRRAFTVLESGSSLAADRSHSAGALGRSTKIADEGRNPTKRPTSACAKQNQGVLESVPKPGSVAHWTMFKSLV